MSEKTQMTAEEKVRAAAAKLIYGTTDAEITLILGITNIGRVNEGIKEVLSPLSLVAPGYKDASPSHTETGTAILRSAPMSTTGRS